MNDTEHTIYVALLDKGVDVWRPVRAKHVSQDVFLIVDQPYDTEIETWQFAPGTEVVCEPRKLYEGVFLVAVSRCP